MNGRDTYLLPAAATFCFILVVPHGLSVCWMGLSMGCMSGWLYIHSLGIYHADLQAWLTAAVASAMQAGAAACGSHFTQILRVCDVCDVMHQSIRLACGIDTAAADD